MLDRIRIQDATNSAGRHLTGRHRGEYETGEGVFYIRAFSCIPVFADEDRRAPSNSSRKHFYSTCLSVCLLLFFYSLSPYTCLSTVYRLITLMVYIATSCLQ